MAKHTGLEKPRHLVLGLGDGFTGICYIIVLYNIHAHYVYSHLKNTKRKKKNCLFPRKMLCISMINRKYT